MLAADGTVTLPASGVQTVTLTATVTDTDGTVKTRDYTLTVYSAAAAAAEGTPCAGGADAGPNV